MDHGLVSNKKRMEMHKRQRVATTETETTTTVARGRTRITTTAAVLAETTSSAASQHERPSFLTASTRTTVAAVTTSTTSTAAVVTTPATTDETTATSSTTARGRATTTSSSSDSPVSNVATGASQSTGFNKATATPINTNPKSNSSGSSSSHGGAVAGAIIAVIAVLAIGVGFFIWKKRRNARLAREGLIGSNGGGFSGGAGGYKKQDESGNHHDTWDGQNNGNGGMTRDDSSLFGGREKTFSQESFGGGGGNAGSGGAGYGATSSWNGNQQGPPQQQQQQFYNAGNQDSAWNVNDGSNAYPPMNQTIPSSTANLLSNQPPLSSSNTALPASLAAGAGAAGIGAARLLAAQSTSPPASVSNFNDAQYQSIEQRELQQELDNRRQSFLNKTQPPLPSAVVAGAGAIESSPFGDSEGQGEIRIVKGTFDPSLDDELVLYPGDKVQVLMKYDDGWALGLNLSSGIPPSKGVFPFDCLGEQVSAPQPSEIRSANSPSPAVQRSLSPINPANIPLPPPTPTLLSPINEDEQPPSSSSVTREGPPQLAPFERSDSPLSPDFPPSSLTIPSSNNASPTKATKLKRHSSLIASRDADLFVALGEVLDKEKH